MKRNKTEMIGIRKTSGSAFGHVTVAMTFQHELLIIGLHFAYSFILKCSSQCRLESIYTTDRRWIWSYLAMARDTIIIQIKFVQKLLSLFSSNMRFNLPLFLKLGCQSIKEMMLQLRVASTEKSKSC